MGENLWDCAVSDGTNTLFRKIVRSLNDDEKKSVIAYNRKCMLHFDYCTTAWSKMELPTFELKGPTYTVHKLIRSTN